MRHFYLTLLFSLFVLQAGLSQGSVTLKDKEFIYHAPKDTAIWNRLNAFAEFKSLDSLQQDFYYWVNVFRKNPTRFYRQEVAAFLREFPEAYTAEAKSLEFDLSFQKPLSFLAPDEGLLGMSKKHAADLAKRGGIISHISSDGKTFQKRFSGAGVYRVGAENIFYGSPSALEALIILLIDHRVADKGHRINLVDDRFTLMGASFSFVSAKKVILVQEFGSK